MREITSGEREKYNKILEEMECQNEQRASKSAIFAEFPDRVEVTNDIIRNRVVLRKGRHSLDILSLLPEGVKFKFSAYEQKYNSTSKTVFCTSVIDELDLFGLLHEIGHAWGHVEKPEIYPKVKEATAERDAWAWALRAMKKLKDKGYISGKFTNKDFIDAAKASLYSYAKYYNKNNKSLSEEFLKKKMNEKDVF